MVWLFSFFGKGGSLRDVLCDEGCGESRGIWVQCGDLVVWEELLPYWEVVVVVVRVIESV